MSYGLRLLNQIDGVYQTFLKSVAGGGLDLFVRNLEDAAKAGRELAVALDAAFERENSINIRRAEATEEQEILRETVNDTSKSYEERKKAGKDYIDSINSYNTEEERLLGELADKTANNIAARIKLTNQGAKDRLKKFYSRLQHIV